MTRLGYALSSEEHTPNDLVRNARAAEDAGFGFALISDHFHPWVDEQGHSPFVWSVIGAIAHATERLRARHRRHVPAHPRPPGDRRPCSGDGLGDDAGPFLSRSRHGREPQRARHRPGLARSGRARRHARGGGRAHAAALAGRLPDVPRRVLLRRERAPLHAARRAGAPGDRGEPAAGRRAGGARGRRLRRRQARPRRDRLVRGRRRRGQAALRPGHRLLGGERGRGPQDRPPRSGRTRASRASCRRSSRCRATSSRRPRTSARTTSQRRLSAATTSTAISS